MTEYKYPILFVLFVAGVIFLEFFTLHLVMADRVYSGGQAAAECGAAGKTVAKYEYSRGNTEFSCENAP